MMNKLITFSILFLIPIFLQAQKKTMTHEVYNQWTKISDTEISNDGNWILYSLSTEVGDKESYLYNTRTNKEVKFERTSSPNIDAASGHLIFWRKPAYENVRQLKLKKTKKDELPKDTVTIYNFSSGDITSINGAKKFTSPQKWGNYLFVHLEPQDTKKDTTLPKPIKDENKENGSKLLVINLSNMSTDTIPYVLSYQTAEENPGLAYVGTGYDTTSISNVYYYNLKTKDHRILTQEDGKYSKLSFSEDARNLAFLADLDTTEDAVRPLQLLMSQNMNPATTIADINNEKIYDGMMISKDRTPRFSKDNTRLFFGIAQIPQQPDTTLLDEEKPVVEVWNTDDPRLYTRQEIQLKNDKTKNFLYVYHINSKSITELGSYDVPDIELSKDGLESKVIGSNDDEYLKYVTWMGSSYSDIYIVDISTGKKKLVLSKVPGYVNNSPMGKYGYWYNREARAYFTLNTNTGEYRNTTNTISSSLADELNDRPMDPRSYGTMGWTTGDKYLLIYDRYDIWKVDPDGINPAINLTNGRINKIVYRYIDLDREEEAINMSKDIVLSVFDENDKTAGYARLSPDGKLTTIFKTPHSYSRRIWKANESEDIVYTKENFDIFPDLIHSTTSFGKATKISNANPQQSEYKWGSGELYSWKDDFGNDQTGMLFKPEGFNPGKKYPMLVNFYEKSSNGIYRHRAPYANRSTINYPYYLSKGYLIFNPDVNYEIGYPGQSAYNAAVSGTQSLIDKGFVDSDRIGLQGHSWGGYQIAHILTKTNMFACAESGAPVVNMVSAYGGIRWGSGMSRMFQYERTQSRLGKTLWENPSLYLENSPIFEMDKVNTPILILHNDADTAVPWYQGIEYFVALRRLNKPAWLLNYNGEPHWPLKWPNRLDFNRRMEQFFDHYLLDGSKPEWMKRGVPAIEKETNLGY